MRQNQRFSKIDSPRRDAVKVLANFYRAERSALNPIVFGKFYENFVKSPETVGNSDCLADSTTP